MDTFQHMAPKATNNFFKGMGWLKGCAAEARRSEASKRCRIGHEGKGHRTQYHSKYTLKSLAGKQYAKVGDVGYRFL